MLDLLGSAVGFLGDVGGTVPARLFNFLRFGLLLLEQRQSIAAGALLYAVLRHPLGVFPGFVREPVTPSHQPGQYRINNESDHDVPRESSTSNTSRHAQGDDTANSSTSQGTTNQPQTGTS